MSSVEVWSIASSLASLVLAVLAIGLSVYFFVQSRITEQRVAETLAKIQAQTETLQKLTGKQLDRLTKFVTDGRSPVEDPAVRELLAVFLQIAKPLATSTGGASATQATTQEQARDEWIAYYIATYYYCGLSNALAQWLLPAPDKFDASEETHILVQRALDGSAEDFAAIEKGLEEFGEARLAANRLASVLEHTRLHWAPVVKNSAAAFVEKSQAE